MGKLPITKISRFPYLLFHFAQTSRRSKEADNKQELVKQHNKPGQQSTLGQQSTPGTENPGLKTYNGKYYFKQLYSYFLYLFCF